MGSGESVYAYPDREKAAGAYSTHFEAHVQAQPFQDGRRVVKRVRRARHSSSTPPVLLSVALWKKEEEALD
jgi:hypothetical protein